MHVSAAHVAKSNVCFTSALTCAGTINAVLWLPGDDHSFIVTATEAGNIRRISLNPRAVPTTLLSHIASPLHGVLSLAYSHALKLVGYTSGSGDAAVIACIARLPMEFFFGPKATTWSHYAPRAIVARTGCGFDGRELKVLWGRDAKCDPVFESSRGDASILQCHAPSSCSLLAMLSAQRIRSCGSYVELPSTLRCCSC